VNRRNRRLRATLLIIAAVVVVGIAFGLSAGEALLRLEYTSVNERFDIRGQQKPPSNVVLVAIEDKTFSDLDVRWPFRRKFHAQVIRNLTRAGAKVIAYDVQFTEPDADHPQDDDKLIEAVRAQPLAVMATTEVDAKQKGLNKVRIFGGALGLRYSRAIPSNSNYTLDSDGRIRRVSFRIQTLETFPLAAARAYQGGRLSVPSGDSAWIDYRGKTPSIRRLSFADVYSGRFRDDQVRGKIVVVGATAPSLQDRHQTSSSGNELMPGPEIQANALVTALEGFPITEAPEWLDVLLLVALGALTPLLALRLRILIALGIGFVALAALLVGAQLAFNREGLIISVVYPAVAGVLALLATALIHGVTVAFEREQARDAFARFVPEAVVDEVLRSADGIRLGGVQREGTVMFSDLRGFTSFAETLEPATVIGALNRYLTAMSEAILDHGGTLVAYMGDGIMAVFGAPLQQDDHADRALAAARDMLDRLDGFNEWLRQEGLHEGFKMGIGLNSGQVMSGHVGSERRLEYTALGDTTNTAARLEGMTKGTPHQLYVADSTRSRLSQPPDDLVEVGEFEVRGRTATVKLWSLREEPAAARDEPAAAEVPSAS
jgi:adenylate cyclase